MHLPSLCPSTPGLYLVILADLNDTNRTIFSTIAPLLAKVSLFLPIPSITLTVLKDHIFVTLEHSTPCATADCTMAQLDDRIARNREELERRPPGNSGRAQALYNLADSLRNRFKETNDIAALVEAIALQRSMLDLRPTDHPDHPRHCHWLAWCLVERHRKQGSLSDLKEAITLQRAALDLCPEGHPDRSYSLYSLAVSLRERYDEQENMADLDESITLGQAALELRPPGHSYRDFSLSHLGHVLRRRFLKLGADADLSEAILLLQSALDLRPEGHDDRPYSLHELAFCFQSPVRQTSIRSRFGGSYYTYSSCFGHTETPIGLGNALRCRFLKFGANADIEEAHFAPSIIVGYLSSGPSRSVELIP